MQAQEDILDDWKEEDTKRHTSWVTITAVAWTAQNLLSLFLLYSLLHTPGLHLGEFLTRNAIWVPLLITHGLSLFSLILLWLGKRGGWVLTMVCCTGYLFNMYARVWAAAQGLWQGLDGNVKSTIVLFLIFGLSVLTFILLLTASVRRDFNIPLRVLIRSVTAGILVVLLIRFLSMKLSGNL